MPFLTISQHTIPQYTQIFNVIAVVARQFFLHQPMPYCFMLQLLHFPSDLIDLLLQPVTLLPVRFHLLPQHLPFPVFQISVDE